MTYNIKARNGKKIEIVEADGVRELHEVLGKLKMQGLKVSNIRRVVVR